MRKNCWVLILISAVLASTAPAAVRRFCLVSYETKAGFSDETKVEVTFETGRELNKATKSYDFDTFENYALIWFGEGQVAVLKIDSILVGVGEDFDNEDFRKLFGILGECDAIQVNAKAARKWKLKGKEYVQWVDSRVDN